LLDVEHPVVEGAGELSAGSGEEVHADRHREGGVLLSLPELRVILMS
jgi:hypothetical protein